MSKVVKIADAIYEEAMEEKSKRELSYMDASSWISFLTEKGLTMIKEGGKKKNER